MPPSLFNSNKEFDALLESLRAWKKLKQTRGVEAETQMRVITALQQAVYGLTELNRFEGHTDIVWGVSFSPDGQLLTSGSRDQTIKLWSRDGKLIKTLNGHRAPVLSVHFSPDGQTLASASGDRTVILWDLHLDRLLLRGCNWVDDYLKHNRNVEERDRLLCEGISHRR